MEGFFILQWSWYGNVIIVLRLLLFSSSFYFCVAYGISWLYYIIISSGWFVSIAYVDPGMRCIDNHISHVIVLISLTVLNI